MAEPAGRRLIVGRLGLFVIAAIVSGCVASGDLQTTKSSSSAPTPASTSSGARRASSAPLTPVDGTRVALVIGNSAYHIGRLNNPGNDARVMAHALRQVGFDVIERYDLTRDSMLKTLIDFHGRMKQDGVALFYFSGHGLQIDGRNYLVPIGAGLESVRYVEIETVVLDRVLIDMAEAKTGLNIVILDACRNNPITRGWRSTVRGLAPTDAPPQTLVAYATGPGDVAQDGEAGGNSPYTGELVKFLPTPGLDIQHVFNRVYQAVIQRTEGRQQPWVAAKLSREFYFVPKQIAAPEIDIYPFEDAIVEREQERITAVVRDELGVLRVNMNVNGRAVSVRFRGGRALTGPERRVEVDTDVTLNVGQNTIEIDAANTAGKVTRITRTLHRTPPAAAVAPPKPNGFLIISSPVEGVDVLVNGRSIGQTKPNDVLVADVPPGQYVILGTKVGHVRWERSVDVTPAQHTRVSIDLRAASAEPPKPPAPAPRAPTVDPPKIFFSYPSEEARLEREKAPVIALVTDERGITRVALTINGQPIPSVAATPDAPTTVEVEASVPLDLGENVIKITATNKAGRTAQIIRRVHRTPPVIAAMPPPPAAKGERYAVIIGIGIYDNPAIPRLRFAENDARSMYELLTTTGGYKKDNVLLITDSAQQKPTLANIKRAIGEWLYKKASRDDAVFIYYAGYGAPEVDASGNDRDGLSKYLIPRDADPESLFVTAFAMDDIETIFRRLQSERVVFIMDTCFSGAASDKTSGSRTFARQRTRSGHMTKEFLDRLAGSKGRVVITASGPNEVCTESPELKHGLFTYYLLKGMTGAADANGDKIVSLNELYAYVQRNTSEHARRDNGKQSPVISGAVGSEFPLIQLRD